MLDIAWRGFVIADVLKYAMTSDLKLTSFSHHFYFVSQVS